MKLMLPEGYSAIPDGNAYSSPQRAFVSDPWGIVFGHISGPHIPISYFTSIRHYVDGESTSVRITDWTNAQAALNHLVAMHTMDPCQCADCQEARVNNKALPHRTATIYGYTPGPSGSAPFAVYPGGCGVLHILTPEGAPLGAVRVTVSAEQAAREWGTAHGLEVTGIRGPRAYEIPRRCVNCGQYPADGTGVMVFESRLWEGSLPTHFVRCTSC